MQAIPSLFECLNSRKSERFVQGLLRFLLVTDEHFRCAFCKWAGWTGDCSGIREEVCCDANRYDLVFDFDEGALNVELKLHAGFTSAQVTNASTIHLVIVPACRAKEVAQLFPCERIRTWESFWSDVASQHELGRVLMRGLPEFVSHGRPTSRYEILRTLQSVEDEFGDLDIIRDFCEQACTMFGFVSTRGAKTNWKYPYVGRYLANIPYFEHKGRDWKQKIWIGFVCERDANNVISRIELVTSIHSEDLARLLGVQRRVAPWYPWESANFGIAGLPNPQGDYVLDDIWTANEKLLQDYAALS